MYVWSWKKASVYKGTYKSYEIHENVKTTANGRTKGVKRWIQMKIEEHEYCNDNLPAIRIVGEKK